MFARTIFKPAMRAQAIKGFATTARPVVPAEPFQQGILHQSKSKLAAKPQPRQGVEQASVDKIMHVLLTGEPPVASVPTTAAPGYEIKESANLFEVAMKVPHDLAAGNLKIEVEDGAKALRIVGDAPDAHGTHFIKRFTAGSALDVEKLQSNFVDGYFVIQAPKMRAFLRG
mmetsp:Transcript_18638/g.35452  ORF Transcript_18638/g.35452 Transcript_18638/m.35452 type:complete len:171 (-) Transcript_18638:124-636(-)|eukprot:scaffold18122_cov194-Amphora_coffeaeformis.AAC.7